MKYKDRIIEKKEYVVVKRLLNISGYHYDTRQGKINSTWLKELEKAKIVNENEMPKDVVRLYSSVTVIDCNGYKNTFKIVLPREHDATTNQLSVLTHIGESVMGCAQGDNLTVNILTHTQHLFIKAVIQDTNRLRLNSVL